LESVTPPGFDVFHISAPDEYFVEIGHTVGLPELPDLIGSSEVVTVGSASIAKLRRSLRSFCKQILTSPSKLEDPELRHKLDVDIPGQLLQTLASSLPEFRKPPTRTRDKALRQAREYIMEFSDEPLTVRDLCRATQVSERTLEYAFLERFHLSPKAYLRNHRLNCVRKELRKVDPFSTKIADVANNWAFWHMGQFAADYRKLFGELPSQTLLVSTAKQAP
jgi:AraC family ethanolamine operon transcriptional activator